MKRQTKILNGKIKCQKTTSLDAVLYSTGTQSNSLHSIRGYIQSSRLYTKEEVTKVATVMANLMGQ